MQSSMRYRTAKLSELVHEKKSYNLHMHSVDKIMNKKNDQFFRRSRQLNELKSRKLQAYNHTQDILKKQIGYVNGLLFAKICKSTLLKKESQPTSLQALQQKIEIRDAQVQTKPDLPSPQGHFVLRNHRQSPIHKSTLLERTRENIRLAKKIVEPVITYKTSEYEKLHQNAKALKERIMKYEPSLAKTKAQIYVKHRLNQSWASFDHKKSELSSARSSIRKLNPEGSNIFSHRFSQYQQIKH